LAIENDKSLNFDELDAVFQNLDKELQDLTGKKKEVKQSQQQEEKKKDSEKSKKTGETVIYCLSHNVLAGSPAEIFQKLQNLEFVFPGQLLLYQNKTKDDKVLYYSGKNVSITEDFSRMYSMTKGIISWRGRNLTVEEMDIIDAEIPPGVGQLNYEKSVYIKSKVADGVKIRSKGDVYVAQNIGDVDIYAEGNIYFLNGITGHGKAKIIARLSIFARFIENADVRAGENLIVEESILNSKISANNAIEMVGRKQIIVGGNYTVGEFVNCKVLGSENFTTTNITAGLLGDERDELEEAQKRIEFIKKRSVEMDTKISGYVVKKTNEGLTDAENADLENLKNEKAKYREEEKKLNDTIKNIESKIQNRINSTVNIEEKVYPGVNIEINKQLYNVQKEIHKVSFVLKDNKIFQDKVQRKKIELNFNEPIKQDMATLSIVDYNKIRRSAVLEASTLEQAQDMAENFLEIEAKRLISITINKTDTSVKVAFFEVKPNENPALVRRKAMQLVQVEKVSASGATIEECLAKASKTLGLPIEELEYRVLQEGSKGILGIGKKDFILEVSKKKEKKVMAVTEKPVDGRFEVQNTIEGLKLRVIAPKGTGKTVEREEVEAYLESKKYMRDIEKKKIAEIVSKADGEQYIIGPRQPEPELDGKFTIEVSPDKLTAYVVITPPKKGGIYPKISEIETELSTKNIKNFDLKEVEESYKKQNSREYKVVVAQGKPMQPPVNPTVELKFETSTGKQNIGDEQIDFKSITSIVNVIEGHLLAVINKGKPGVEGIDVYGAPIPPPPMSEVPIKAGKNVRVSEDGLKFFSEIEGWVMFENNVIKVENVYQINGDVDYNTGNITSLGTVIVKGTVKDGFRVEATGDIIVNAVEAAELVAEGSITIKSGIQGKGTGTIKAKGNVYAKFVEQANIETESSLVVTDSIMHSNVIAKEHIIVLKGKKGLIVGGKYRAGTVIAAKNIGSKVATLTQLEVGFDPFIKAELDKTLEKTTYLKEEYVQTRLNLQRLINEIKTVGEQNVDKEKKDMLKKLTDKYQKISLEVKELNTQLQKLQLKLRENKKGFIFAREKMFTNIEIGIRNLSYKVREETDFCTFYDENGEIKWKQFDEIILNKYAGALMATAEKEEKTKNK